MSTAEKRHYTPQEYLAFERASETKHEFYQGEIFAMTGASREHNLIVFNLLREIGNHLENTPCEVYPSDMRVKVNATGLYTYPNVTVVCSQPRFENDVFDTLLNPKLIVEVLSESTEAYDRGQKFAQYRTIPSLEEYILISQNAYFVEDFTKQENGQWLLSEARGPEASIQFHSIDCSLTMAELYRRVEIPEKTRDEQHD